MMASVPPTPGTLPPALEAAWRGLTAALRDANRSMLDVARALWRAERLGVAAALGWEDTEAMAQELAGYRRRKTRALITLWQAWVETCRVEPGRLAAVPWTRLALLASVVAPETAEGWLARARTTSCDVLRAELRAAAPAPPAAPPVRVAKRFHLPPDAEPVLELALEAAGRAAATDDRGRQLELLAAEYLASRREAPAGWLVARLDGEAARAVGAALARLGAATPGEAVGRLAAHWLGCQCAVTHSGNDAVAITYEDGGLG
jgi:hypothetical protein